VSDIRAKRAKLSDLIPDDRNANTGTLRGLAMLDDSLREDGAGRGILLDKHNKVIAGNKTLERAADLGFTEVIVVPTDGKQLVATQRVDIDINSKQGRRMAIRDNRVGEVDLAWDAETLAGLADDVDLSQFFDDDELAAILAGASEEPKADSGPQLDKAAELQAKWRVAPGDLWTIGAHRLLCGNSTQADDVARVMGADRIEMVWTDPPYGVSVGDKNKMLNAIAPSNRVEENLTGDTLDEPGIVSMLERSFDNTIAHCTAGAGWYVAAPAGPPHVLFGLVLKARGIWRQTLQWVKNNSTFSPMGVCYHWQAEPIFFGWLPNGAHRFYGGRAQTTVWNIDRPMASPEHPTMKPVELVTRAIENSSRRGEIVADFFAGSGTTLAACEQVNRRGRAIEIEPRYCAVILQRLADMGLAPERAS
jgi:DNA modification methylase